MMQIMQIPTNQHSRLENSSLWYRPTLD